MLNSFLAFLNKSSSLDGRLEIQKPNATNIVYRDELVRKKASQNKKTKKVRFLEVSEPILNKEEEEVGCREEKRGGVRIKVKMTKEEAARMLSKCKEGGILEFKDLASELVQIPSARVCVLPPTN